MTAATAAWLDEAVDVGGRSWTYRSAGTGDAVLVLDPDDETGSSKVFDALTDRWRVIATRLPAASAGAGEDLAHLIEALDVAGCAVVARDTAAAAALSLALAHPEAVGTLVLESPALDVALTNRLPSIETPTLVLLGQRTEAASPAHAGVYKRLPGSTVGLVYDAGTDIRTDRPSAYLSAVGDYLERGQAFVVNIQTTVIND